MLLSWPVVPPMIMVLPGGAVMAVVSSVSSISAASFVKREKTGVSFIAIISLGNLRAVTFRDFPALRKRYSAALYHRPR